MKLYHFVFALLLCGCSPLINKTIIDTGMKPQCDSCEVMVVDVTQPMPDSCKVLGTLHYGENGASPSWGYNKLITEAEKQARLMGGNLMKITYLQIPEEGVTYSYSIYLTVLYRQNLSNIPKRLRIIADSLHKIKFPEPNPTYAILYVYRPSGLGALIGYNIELNDNVICRAKDNSYYEIKLYKEGPATFVAHTESTSRATINVKFGEEYYLRCTIGMGVIVGEPYLKIIPNWQGSDEYEQMKNAEKK